MQQGLCNDGEIIFKLILHLAIYAKTRILNLKYLGVEAKSRLFSTADFFSLRNVTSALKVFNNILKKKVIQQYPYEGGGWSLWLLCVMWYLNVAIIIIIIIH